MVAKVYLVRHEYKKAIDYLKMYKSQISSYDSEQYPVDRYKLKAYKSLGRCYQELHNYSIALTYHCKYLQYAWTYGSDKDELMAYDLMGMQYYYMGDLEKANYYHSRMSNGKLEPNDSNTKQIGISRVKLQQKNGSKKFQNLIDYHKHKALHDKKEGDGCLSSDDEVFEPPVILENDLRELKAKYSGKSTDQHSSVRTKICIPKRNKQGSTRELGKGKIYLNPKGKELLYSITPTNTSAPKDPILLGHLSRNRQLKNFSLLSKRDELQDENSLALNELIDVKAAERIKSILEKFKVNLLSIKTCLEVCDVQSKETHIGQKGKTSISFFIS